MTTTPTPEARVLEQVAHRFGIVHQHQLEQVTSSLDEVRRLASLIDDKMGRLLSALDDPDVERQLYHVRSLAQHAGYSNTMAANMADLLTECGRLDATIDAWVRAWHAACDERSGG